MWPDNRAPFRRAARFDGVHPLLFSVPLVEQPAALRDLVAYVDDYRDRPDRPYDVAFGPTPSVTAGPRPRAGGRVCRGRGDLVDGTDLALAWLAGRDAVSDQVRTAAHRVPVGRSA